MGERAKEELEAHVGRRARRQRGAEVAFEATEVALSLPALAIRATGEPMEEATPVRRAARGSRPSAMRAQVDCDHDPRNAEPLMTEGMMGFGIVAFICEQRRNEARRQEPTRLVQDGRELRTVVGGAAGDDRTHNPVRGTVGQGREFGPLMRRARPRPIASDPEIVADMVQFEPGRIDRDCQASLEQPAVDRRSREGELERANSSPFSSRCAA